MGMFKYVDDDKILRLLEKAQNEGLSLYTYVYKEAGLLYIEPTAKTSDEPLVDELTRKMTAALYQAEFPPMGFMGFYICKCKKATSKANDFILPNGLFTNSLCIHYLAYHRDEVPKDQLEIVANLNFGEVVPTPEELNPNCTSFSHIKMTQDKSDDCIIKVDYEKSCRINRTLYHWAQLLATMWLVVLGWFVFQFFQGYFPNTFSAYLLSIGSVIVGGFCFYVKRRLGI